MSSFEKIRSYLQKKGGDKAKKVLSSKEMVIIAILAGIILIIASTSMFSSNKTDNKTPSETEVINKNTDAGSEEISKLVNIKEIESIISKIDGAGKISVMITYESGIEKVPGTDNSTSESSTVEKDAQGGNREIADTKEDSKVVYEDGDASSKKVFVSKEIQPEIKGVLIVSSGAGDAQISSSITQSAKVLFNLPMHKIQVVEGNK